MSELQVVIGSIVNDVIQARFEADVYAAELSEQYRDSPGMRGMTAPRLNISNLSVELRMVFDEAPVELATEPSDAQHSAVASAADDLRKAVLSLQSAEMVPARSKSAFSRALNARAAAAATSHLASSSAVRRAAIDGSMIEVLAKYRVKLSEDDRQTLSRELDLATAEISRAPGRSPKSVPGILIGKETLSEVDPSLVSVIKFDVELTDNDWVDVEINDGEFEPVLVDRWRG